MPRFIQNLLKRCDDKLRIEIDRLPPEGMERLPTTLWPFFWFFLRQLRGPLIGIAIVEVLCAVMVSLMFWYVGILVAQGNHASALIWLGLGLLASRLVFLILSVALYDLLYTPHVGNLIRRQLYWYTTRQSLAFFQNDFAGRIANKLIQSAPSLRDTVHSSLGALCFAAIFTTSNLLFLANASLWLALPLIVWLALYVLTLWHFVPIIRKRSAEHSEDMSTLVGQVVDSFTNFLTIKYFARTEHEDRRVITLLKNHGRSLRRMSMTIFGMKVTVAFINTLLMLSTGLVAFWLIDTQGQAGLAAAAMALPMALQATFQSGWIMFEVSGIFQNLGTVQEGIDALSKPHGIVDRPDATKLETSRKSASIAYKNVYFNYDRQEEDSGPKPVLNGFSLTIPAGQKVGLVGRSGAGKSTITSLLVRAYDIRDGEILIDGQNIAHVTQDSLREKITVVTQESYLFHRSILENIRYGNLDADMDAVMEAARKANAHEFILGLEDYKGRKGYDAHVGERGVKLSGGQKQRIGIARAILKDAPILILDEATSALDSESEHAIQNALENIMEDKTVIAIAHRLSTLRQMDRIIVMESGRIVEDGTHAELVRTKNGPYAKLWKMQSGGFLNEEKVMEPA